MTTQLTLLAPATRPRGARGTAPAGAPSPWRLDATTRAIGHEGLAAARAALAAARPRVDDPFRARAGADTTAAAA